DALPDGFVLYGPRGEIRRMNDAAARMIKPTPEGRELPLSARWGRYRASSADGWPVEAEQSPPARALAGEIVRGLHLRVENAGESTWLLASAAPIRAPDGTVWGAVVTFTDETPLHALEEARDDLVRMISHDLRTPLNAVLAQAHMIQRAGGEQEKVEERAQAIVRSCHRMAGMIQDLLDATLLEAGQLRMNRRPLDLQRTVRDMIERQRGALDVDRVRVSTGSPPPDPVRADPERLERIVVNLLSNALKYSPPESEVEVEVAAGAGGAVLTVSDRGIGISPEDLPHLFERFFRARGTRRPEGIGLGLYISRLLVEAHGGRIDVQSVLGQGTTLRVFLPADTAVQARPDVP
ncbi:MAG TPA: PAS domain-containing sensor histidine kinase, partial [Anaeromyxobacteraceae bacterium]|nr:PAS domain-containing sensor histidine kinase [Anaeromyxobacteraceae bacterium]